MAAAIACARATTPGACPTVPVTALADGPPAVTWRRLPAGRSACCGPRRGTVRGSARSTHADTPRVASGTARASTMDRRVADVLGRSSLAPSELRDDPACRAERSRFQSPPPAAVLILRVQMARRPARAAHRPGVRVPPHRALHSRPVVIWRSVVPGSPWLWRGRARRCSLRSTGAGSVLPGSSEPADRPSRDVVA